jgi:antitoxin component HigA of HigAB toxin-antitoxin module
MRLARRTTARRRRLREHLHMTQSEPELWQLSSLDTRYHYESAVTELRRLIESRPAVGTEERDQLVALHLLCARYESEHLPQK